MLLLFFVYVEVFSRVSLKANYFTMLFSSCQKRVGEDSIAQVFFLSRAAKHLI